MIDVFPLLLLRRLPSGDVFSRSLVQKGNSRLVNRREIANEFIAMRRGQILEFRDLMENKLACTRESLLALLTFVKTESTNDSIS